MEAAPRTAKETELWYLQTLAEAERLTSWMSAEFAPYARGVGAEVGAGIGTFSARLLAGEVQRLLLIEPEPSCVGLLEARFGEDPRVSIVAEALPDSCTLADRRSCFDFVLCQNVLEHIRDDEAAVAAMAKSLRPGGWLCLLVPAHPRLFGPLDRRFGHYRRYDRARVRRVLVDAGLRVVDLHSFNLLGIAGWWVQGKRRSPRISPASLRVYEALVPLWRPVERVLRPPWGLSLVAHAQKPA